MGNCVGPIRRPKLFQISVTGAVTRDQVVPFMRIVAAAGLLQPLQFIQPPAVTTHSATCGLSLLILFLKQYPYLHPAILNTNYRKFFNFRISSRILPVSSDFNVS